MKLGTSPFFTFFEFFGGFGVSFFVFNNLWAGLLEVSGFRVYLRMAVAERSLRSEV